MIVAAPFVLIPTSSVRFAFEPSARTPTRLPVISASPAAPVTDAPMSICPTMPPAKPLIARLRTTALPALMAMPAPEKVLPPLISSSGRATVARTRSSTPTKPPVPTVPAFVSRTVVPAGPHTPLVA